MTTRKIIPEVELLEANSRKFDDPRLNIGTSQILTESLTSHPMEGDRRMPRENAFRRAVGKSPCHAEIEEGAYRPASGVSRRGAARRCARARPNAMSGK